MEAADQDQEEERRQDGQPSSAAPHDGLCSSHLIMEEFVMGNHTRLLSFLWITTELTVSSPLFAKLSTLFSYDVVCLESLAHARGHGRDRLCVVVYRLRGMQCTAGYRGSASATSPSLTPSPPHCYSATICQLLY